MKENLVFGNSGKHQYHNVFTNWTTLTIYLFAMKIRTREVYAG